MNKLHNIIYSNVCVCLFVNTIIVYCLYLCVYVCVVFALAFQRSSNETARQGSPLRR